MMSQTYPWSQMLDDFRALGGTADNIEQRRGHYGNGLFPIDPGKPVAIAIPAHLLVDTDQLILAGDHLVVSTDAQVAEDVRRFIGRYQQHFSWGADGRRHAEAFESALKTLPDPLLERLRQIRLLNLEVRHRGPWAEVLRRRFHGSRQIIYHERKVSMPIIELINHASKSPGYAINDGIQYKGQFADEIKVNYSPTSDALLRFLNYGFASPELQAYSLPMHLKLPDGGTLHIGANAGDVELKDKLPVPKVEIEGARRRLAHLRLGMARTPRLPRTLLRLALADLPTAQVDELFDRIRHANQQILCDLLELADGADTPIAREFRRALLFQLRALSHSHGVRPEVQTSAA
jgi:hypothetical protein